MLILAAPTMHLVEKILRTQKLLPPSPENDRGKTGWGEIRERTERRGAAR